MIELIREVIHMIGNDMSDAWLWTWPWIITVLIFFRAILEKYFLIYFILFLSPFAIACIYMWISDNNKSKESKSIRSNIRYRCAVVIIYIILWAKLYSFYSWNQSIDRESLHAEDIDLSFPPLEIRIIKDDTINEN